VGLPVRVVPPRARRSFQPRLRQSVEREVRTCRSGRCAPIGKSTRVASRAANRPPRPAAGRVDRHRDRTAGDPRAARGRGRSACRRAVLAGVTRQQPPQGDRQQDGTPRTGHRCGPPAVLPRPGPPSVPPGVGCGERARQRGQQPVQVAVGVRLVGPRSRSSYSARLSRPSVRAVRSRPATALRPLSAARISPRRSPRPEDGIRGCHARPHGRRPGESVVLSRDGGGPGAVRPAPPAAPTGSPCGVRGSPGGVRGSPGVVRPAPPGARPRFRDGAR
jgi:hypothetical protein